jgi:hypothetical protein
VDLSPVVAVDDAHAVGNSNAMLYAQPAAGKDHTGAALRHLRRQTSGQDHQRPRLYGEFSGNAGAQVIARAARRFSLRQHRLFPQPFDLQLLSFTHKNTPFLLLKNQFSYAANSHFPQSFPPLFHALGKHTPGAVKTRRFLSKKGFQHLPAFHSVFHSEPQHTEIRKGVGPVSQPKGNTVQNL